MRKAGVLLPMASLMGSYGIGDLGKDSFWWIDFLQQSQQKIWQVLPLCPLSYGDSPYQSPSLFAINPLYISLDVLREEGLLSSAEILQNWPLSTIDYTRLFATRKAVLQKAFTRFNGKNQPPFLQFVHKNREWVFDYASYMVFKEKYHYQAWDTWNFTEKDYSNIDQARFQKENQWEIDFWCFVQYIADKQWNDLHQYAQKKGIEIIGDMPIYPAWDSADVWAHTKLFCLDDAFAPQRVAGCPPDDFAPTGQLWGNPVYDWEQMKQEKYAWWISRFQRAFSLFDTVRVDHFRGWFSFYAVDSFEDTAEHGKWYPGGGEELIKAITQTIKNPSLIMEDLGYITDDIKKRMHACGYPPMKVLQFAFSMDTMSEHLPCCYEKNCVCYTGTHDNDTLYGWLTTLPYSWQKYVMEYTQSNSIEQAVDHLIAIALASKAERVIIPIQDYLQLDSGARVNKPGSKENNWQWRLSRNLLTEDLRNKMAHLAKIYWR